MTNNEHRKTSNYIEEMEELRKEDETLDNGVKETEKENEDIDFTALKSLQDDGIDMSFLDNLQKQYGENNIKQEEETVDNLELLRANAQLIDQLKNIQSERLSATPPPHFSQLPKPNEKEV